MDGGRESVGVPVLARDLRARREATDDAGTLRILAYPGTTGYDVVLAMRAAREAGFSRVEGIAEYDESGAPGVAEKRWAQELLSQPTPVLANDTPRRAS